MDQVDAIVVGAGFGGLRTLYALRQLGLRVQVLEASDDVGGVWHANRYPGARCDVESYDYSLSFSPELEREWRWSERYATQPEVLRYIHHVADRFDLRRDVLLDTRMTEATWDAAARRWTVHADGGRAWSARWLIMAVGQLSATKRPHFPGEETFAGPIFHSAEWPRERPHLAGKRVGIIGTGSSGVQMTPIVAQEAAHLTVFQRTANYSIPAANAPISDEEDAAVKADYAARRDRARNSPSGLGFAPNAASALEATPEERERVYAEAYERLGFGFALAYKDVLLDEASNRTAADFIHARIAEKVHDPRVRDLLTPKGFPFGAKRPSVDSQYFETFNRPNVTLVDIRSDPIEAITPDGVRTLRETYPLDVLIMATGFDAFTGSLLKPVIAGEGGRTLKEAWSAGPVSYLGLAAPEFPNMFILVGPGSPSLLSNVILSTEQQVEWLAALLQTAGEAGAQAIAATPQAAAAWVAHVNARSEETLYPRAASYYVGAEVEGKPRVFMPYSGGVRQYRRILERTAEAGYPGLSIQDGEGRRVFRPEAQFADAWASAPTNGLRTQSQAAA